jgi:SAM-dependent methyltransferase
MQSPWWESFFSGFMLEFAPSQYYPAEQTKADVDFLVQVLAPQPGAHILDVPCGEGRVSIPLAERGYHVTGVDITAPWLAKGAATAKERNLPAAFEPRDMRDLPWNAKFDHACCVGNSFGYFPHEQNADFLRAVQQVLKPGGRFVLQTNFCAESILTQPLGRRWYPMGELVFLHNSRYDPPTGQLISDYLLIKNGQIESKQATYQTYSYRELMRMFADAGFKNTVAYGNQKCEPFQLGAKDLWIIAER